MNQYVFWNLEMQDRKTYTKYDAKYDLSYTCDYSS